MYKPSFAATHVASLDHLLDFKGMRFRFRIASSWVCLGSLNTTSVLFGMISTRPRHPVSEDQSYLFLHEAIRQAAWPCLDADNQLHAEHGLSFACNGVHG